MPKSSKLLSALDRKKGRNFKLEKQRKQEKAAASRKAKHQVPEEQEDSNDEEWEDAEEGEDLTDKLESAGVTLSKSNGTTGQTGLESEDEDEDVSDAEDSSEDDEAGGIPLSDIESLASEDKADIIPHQRLTINNTSALLTAHKSIALPKTASFSANQTLTSSEQIEIKDVHDDLTRELAFYKQCLEAAVEGQSRLTKEGASFTRPNDYFAEMVKTDEHMGKIKAKMVEEAANKKASAEARKQRDLKKFGKQVQIAKQQERDKSKRETLDKISTLKRKRKGNEAGDAKEEDMFDVALDNEITKPDRRAKGGKGGKDGKPNSKRQKKDEKFGYGGKKKFAKSGDAVSSGDLKGFSTKNMKGGGRKTARPGKSKRANKL